MTGKERVKTFLKNNVMTVRLLCGVLSGVLLGFILRRMKEKHTQREIMYVGFMGEIFLQMLKAVALPLMISCIVASIGRLDMKLSRRLGGQLVLFIALTKLQACTLTIVIALLARPGYGLSSTDSDRGERNFTAAKTTVDTFLDLIRNMFPSNIVEMSLKQYTTVLIKPDDSSEDDLSTWDIKEGGEMIDSINMLGVVNISILIGIGLGLVEENGLPLLAFFESVSKVTMVITMWVMSTAPICIASLIASQFLQVEDFGSLMSKLGLYLATLFLLFSIQAFAVYPFLYFVFVRKFPYTFIWNFSEALITAAATASSNASLPVSIKCMIEKNRVDPRLVHFIMPVGASINMDGAAIFQCLATMFVAQMYDRHLTSGEIAMILVLSAAASVAAAGVPHNAVVTLVLVLTAMNLPLTEVSLFFAIDWLCDRYQTPVNILGDAIAAGILDACNKDLLESTNKQDEDIKNQENQETEKTK